MNRPTIALFGLGHMGSAVARRLATHGFSLLLWNRTRERLSSFDEQPFSLAASPEDAARRADLWITFLSDGPATLELWTRQDGLRAALSEEKNPSSEKIWMQMATLDYSTTLRLAGDARKRGVRFIDIPVLGSTGEASKGELILMAGGHPEDLERIRPVTDVLGKTVVHCGPVGSGTLMKLTTNLLLAHLMTGLAEWFTFGSQMGLHPDDMFRVIRDSKLFTPMFAAKFPKLKNDDYTPSFPLKWMRKDLNNILDAAHHFGSFLPVASIMKTLYDAADFQGLGDDDYSAVVHLLKQLSRGTALIPR